MMNKLTSAPQLWVFLAITIPLTFAVFSVWKLRSIWHTKKIESQMDLEGGGPLGGERLVNGGSPKTLPKVVPFQGSMVGCDRLDSYSIISFRWEIEAKFCDESHVEVII
jgi:hypothetical protein